MLSRLWNWRVICRGDYVGVVIGKQLVRSATSVDANYRAGCRARSGADFIAKLKIVEEELDETLYWMELLQEGRLIDGARLEPIAAEGNELLAMVVASIKTRRDHEKTPVQSSIVNHQSSIE